MKTYKKVVQIWWKTDDHTNAIRRANYVISL